jgi:hypothetical protein
LIRITYECRAGGAPAIDILTGIENAHEEIFLAEWGPGTALPDAAVPIPATPGLQIPGADSVLLYLYGGYYTQLVQGPEPGGNCEHERSLTVPVRAMGERVVLLGSLWLADSADHAGQGADDAGVPIHLSASVSGVGSAGAAIDPAVIRP